MVEKIKMLNSNLILEKYGIVSETKDKDIILKKYDISPINLNAIEFKKPTKIQVLEEDEEFILVPHNEKELGEFRRDVERGSKIELEGAYGEPVYIQRHISDIPDIQRYYDTVDEQRKKEAIEIIDEVRKSIPQLAKKVSSFIIPQAEAAEPTNLGIKEIVEKPIPEIRAIRPEERRYRRPLTETEKARAVVDLLYRERGEKIPRGLQLERAITSPEAQAITTAVMFPAYTALKAVRGAVDREGQFNLEDRIIRGIIEPEAVKSFYEYIPEAERLPQWAKVTADLVETIVALGAMGLGRAALRQELLKRDIPRKISIAADQFANENLNRFLPATEKLKPTIVTAVKADLKNEYIKRAYRSVTALDAQEITAQRAILARGGIEAEYITQPSILQQYAQRRTLLGLIKDELGALGEAGSIPAKKVVIGDVVRWAGETGRVLRLEPGKAILEIAGKEIIAPLSELMKPKFEPIEPMPLAEEIKPKISVWEKLNPKELKYFQNAGFTPEVYRKNLETEEGRDIILGYREEFINIQREEQNVKNLLRKLFATKKSYSSEEIAGALGISEVSPINPRFRAFTVTFREMIDEKEIEKIGNVYTATSKIKPPIVLPRITPTAIAKGIPEVKPIPIETLKSQLIQWSKLEAPEKFRPIEGLTIRDKEWQELWKQYPEFHPIMRGYRETIEIKPPEVIKPKFQPGQQVQDIKGNRGIIKNSQIDKETGIRFYQVEFPEGIAQMSEGAIKAIEILPISTKLFKDKLYRGMIPGKEDAQIGQYLTKDKDKAQFYKEYKEQKTGKKGKIIQEEVIFSNPLYIKHANVVNGFLDEFENIIPEIKEIKNIFESKKNLTDKKVDDLIVKAEQSIANYAKQQGYDGVVFKQGEIVIDLRKPPKIPSIKKEISLTPENLSEQILTSLPKNIQEETTQSVAKIKKKIQNVIKRDIAKPRKEKLLEELRMQKLNTIAEQLTKIAEIAPRLITPKQQAYIHILKEKGLLSEQQYRHLMKLFITGKQREAYYTPTGRLREWVTKAEPKPPVKPPIPPTPPEDIPHPQASIPPEDPIKKLNELLKETKPIRGIIERAYTAERAKRIAEVERAITQIGGEKGYAIALSKLKGALLEPGAKIVFEPLKEKLPKETIDALYNMTFKHPYLDEWEKISAADGLTKLLTGEVPQPKQLLLLEEIYGTDLIKNILAKRALGLKIKDVVVDVMNIPRAFLATADMSAFLRQGVVYVVSHPIIASKAIRKTFQFAFSPKAFEQYFKDLTKDPLYPLMRKSKLQITDPSRALASGREEAFISRLLQQIPILGHIIKFAERSYVGFLNKLRVDIFKSWTDELLSKEYSPIKDKDIFKNVADVVNNFTGRGDLRTLNRITPELNTILFSPRLIAARFNALNPIWYVRQSKTIRVKAIGDFAKFVGAGLVLLAILKASGLVNVEIDPRSSDFGKIKIGNTRFDIWGGFQQWVRVFAQVITGKRKNASTGEIISLTKEEYPFTTRKEVLLRFIEGKLAPIPALVNELISGTKTFQGEDITPATVAKEKFIPIYIQDIADAYKDGGLGRATGAGIAAFFGIGVQTWQPKGKGVDVNTILNKYGISAETIDRNSILNKYGVK